MSTTPSNSNFHFPRLPGYPLWTGLDADSNMEMRQIQRGVNSGELTSSQAASLDQTLINDWYQTPWQQPGVYAQDVASIEAQIRADEAGGTAGGPPVTG